MQGWGYVARTIFRLNRRRIDNRGAIGVSIDIMLFVRLLRGRVRFQCGSLRL